MKIVYILETFPSVTESFILNEILQLKKRGIDISVVALRKSKNLQVDQVAVYYIDLLSWRGLIRKVQFISKHMQRVVQYLIANRRTFLGAIGKSFRSIKYMLLSVDALEQVGLRNVQHLHAHFASMPADLAIVMSELSQIPFSISAHAHDIYTDPQSLIPKINKSQFIVTCTRFNQKFLRELSHNCDHDKIHHVYHGIKLSEWPLRIKHRRNHKLEINILTVARLEEKKGLIYLIDSVILLLGNGYDIILKIIGDGSLYQLFQKYIKDRELDSNITLLGSKSHLEVKEYFQKADLFVLPCIQAGNHDMDGLPNVFPEALASGVPVISTDLSAIPELIENENTGLLVKEKDSEAIAAAVIKILSTPNLYDEIVKNGRERVEEFCIETSTSLLECIFRNYAVGA